MQRVTQRQATNQGVSWADVKVCALCGSLNLRDNRECFTCAWSGAFEDNPASIATAWERLEAEQGPVRREHVSGGSTSAWSGFQSESREDHTPARPTWRSRLAAYCKWWPR